MNFYFAHCVMKLFLKITRIHKIETIESSSFFTRNGYFDEFVLILSYLARQKILRSCRDGIRPIINDFKTINGINGIYE
jgi:hypothetical protein